MKQFVKRTEHMWCYLVTLSHRHTHYRYTPIKIFISVYIVHILCGVGDDDCHQITPAVVPNAGVGHLNWIEIHIYIYCNHKIWKRKRQDG